MRQQYVTLEQTFPFWKFRSFFLRKLKASLKAQWDGSHHGKCYEESRICFFL